MTKIVKLCNMVIESILKQFANMQSAEQNPRQRNRGDIDEVRPLYEDTGNFVPFNSDAPCSYIDATGKMRVENMLEVGDRVSNEAGKIGGKNQDEIERRLLLQKQQMNEHGLRSNEGMGNPFSGNDEGGYGGFNNGGFNNGGGGYGGGGFNGRRQEINFAMDGSNTVKMSERQNLADEMRKNGMNGSNMSQGFDSFSGFGGLQGVSLDSFGNMGMGGFGGGKGAAHSKKRHGGLQRALPRRCGHGNGRCAAFHKPRRGAY